MSLQAVSPSSGSSGGSSSSRKRSLSAAERERREEEQRRRQRAEEVVIGKTSAVKGEKDFEIDISATEEQWMRQATRLEQEIFRETEMGMKRFKMLQLEGAIAHFDRVFELRPTAYLWQAGIAKYYVGDLKDAADIFAKCAERYESKFGQPATEERIWRHACELKLRSTMSRKDRKAVEENGGMENYLTQIPVKDNTDELMQSEHRKVMRLTRDLFAASINHDHAATILSIAKLRAIGGRAEDLNPSRPVLDRKMWKLNSWYYMGLHYDAVGDYYESKKCMKMALRLCPSAGHGDDIIHTLPMLHMARREWFDDDDFDDNDPMESSLPQDDGPDLSLDYQSASATGSASSSPSCLSSDNETSSSSYKKSAEYFEPGSSLGRRMEDVDPLIRESIQTNLLKLKLIDLQDALRARGLRAFGSKKELQERLFVSLILDNGLLQ